MEKDHQKEIENMIGQLQCSKNFICCKSGLKVLCKAKDVGRKSHLECLDEDPLECNFSLSFGGKYYCNCPIRIYIAKKLKK